MSTTGRTINRAVGQGAAFSGAQLNGGQVTFTLAPALHQLVVQMTDAANPGSITITDPNGNSLTFNQHGEYRYAAQGHPGTTGATPYTMTCTGGVDLVALTVIGDVFGTDGSIEVFC